MVWKHLAKKVAQSLKLDLSPADEYAQLMILHDQIKVQRRDQKWSDAAVNDRALKINQRLLQLRAAHPELLTPVREPQRADGQPRQRVQENAAPAPAPAPTEIPSPAAPSQKQGRLLSLLAAHNRIRAHIETLVSEHGKPAFLKLSTSATALMSNLQEWAHDQADSIQKRTAPTVAELGNHFSAQKDQMALNIRTGLSLVFDNVRAQKRASLKAIFESSQANTALFHAHEIALSPVYRGVVPMAAIGTMGLAFTISGIQSETPPTAKLLQSPDINTTFYSVVPDQANLTPPPARPQQATNTSNEPPRTVSKNQPGEANIKLAKNTEGRTALGNQKSSTPQYTPPAKSAYEPPEGGSGIQVTTYEELNTLPDKVVYDKGVLGIESGGQHFWANGKVKVSPAGAIGAAQVMPGTAPIAARMCGMEWSNDKYRNDPSYNKKLGWCYFKGMKEQFGHTTLAVLAYNRGPENLERDIARIGDPRRGDISWSRFISRIPHPEARAYVPGVMASLRKEHNRPGNREVDASYLSDTFVLASHGTGMGQSKSRNSGYKLARYEQAEPYRDPKAQEALKNWQEIGRIYREQGAAAAQEAARKTADNSDATTQSAAPPSAAIPSTVTPN